MQPTSSWGMPQHACIVWMHASGRYFYNQEPHFINIDFLIKIHCLLTPILCMHASRKIPWTKNGNCDPMMDEWKSWHVTVTLTSRAPQYACILCVHANYACMHASIICKVTCVPHANFLPQLRAQNKQVFLRLDILHACILCMHACMHAFIIGVAICVPYANFLPQLKAQNK